MRNLLILCSLCYPFLIYYGLQSLGPRLLLGVLLVIGALRYATRGAASSALSSPLLLGLSTVFVTWWILGMYGNQEIVVLFYPVLVSAALLVVFVDSLFRPPTIVERVARRMEGTLPIEAVAYCRTVTVVWSLFFFLNGIVSALLALFGTIRWWTFYCGFASYLLMGVVFVVEIVCRRIFKRRLALKRIEPLALLLLAYSSLLLLPLLSYAEGAPSREILLDDLKATTLSELQDITQKLSTIETLSAKMSQEKFIPALSRPVRSQGTFVYMRDRGIAWQVVAPYQETFLMGARGISRLLADGEVDRVGADQNPAVRGFTKVFLSLFRADLEPLAEQFELSVHRDSSRWTLGLAAKGADVKKFIDLIVLSGNSWVEQVQILEASGDFARIVFSDQSNDPTRVPADLQSRLAAVAEGGSR